MSASLVGTCGLNLLQVSSYDFAYAFSHGGPCLQYVLLASQEFATGTFTLQLCE